MLSFTRLVHPNLPVPLDRLQLVDIDIDIAVVVVVDVVIVVVDVVIVCNFVQRNIFGFEKEGFCRCCCC